MKKILKSWLYSLFCVIVLITLFTTAVYASDIASGKCGDNLSWVLSDDYTLSIDGYGDMYDYTTYNDIVPWSNYSSSIKKVIFTDEITHIGDKAFYKCSGLTQIAIPRGVTSIGKYAFYLCDGLSEVIIPEGVTSIGSEAFYSCNCLTSIVIPGVDNICERAFSACKGLIIVDILDGTSCIGDNAFLSCSSLSSISIPEGVTSIGANAFAGCVDLADIVIPEGLKSIGDCAFSNCTTLTDITIPKSVESMGIGIFQSCRGLISISLPEDMTIIGDRTFFGCRSLNNITIPEGVTYIGNQAFAGCYSLSSISIPEGVTRICDSAFSSCTSLTKIVFPKKVSLFGIGVLNGCSSLKQITIPFASFNINTVTYPFGYLFGQQSTPNTVGTVQYYSVGSGSSVQQTYYIPSSLEEVTVLSGEIKTGTFKNCKFIKKIILDDVISISGAAFYNCEALASIVIPEKINGIAYNAFNGCSGLKQLIYKGTESQWASISGINFCYLPYGIQIEYCEARINDINFPDSFFREYISNSFDLDSDGMLMSSECNAVKKLKLYERISSTKGIEYFDNLEEIRLSFYDGVELTLPNADEEYAWAVVDADGGDADSYGCWFCSDWIEPGTTVSEDHYYLKCKKSDFCEVKYYLNDGSGDYVIWHSPINSYGYYYLYGLSPWNSLGGNYLKCWNTKPDGSGDSYAIGVPNEIKEISLYAQWYDKGSALFSGSGHLHDEIQDYIINTYYSYENCYLDVDIYFNSPECIGNNAIIALFDESKGGQLINSKTEEVSNKDIFVQFDLSKYANDIIYIKIFSVDFLWNPLIETLLSYANAI